MAAEDAEIYTLRMQYSLRTIMLSILALALLLVLPGPFFWLLWMLLPTFLAGLWRYGSALERDFAIGALLGYLALALQLGAPGGALWIDLIRRTIVLGLSGGLMLLLHRWLDARSIVVEPPRWTRE